QMLKALAPLIEHYRAEQQGYFAELAKKLADLARLQLDIPYRHEEIEERVFDVAGEHEGYVTLQELAGDWRLNHFPRQPIQEAVDMLVVRGRLRPTVLKLESEDPERPYTFLPAYTPVAEKDVVSAEEIEL
ncbi:MAG TPA: hypothetical protein PKD55_21200, partial [Bellilinea sp.]|nr:hypothetical protein [Bellilinea sp.]